MPSWHLVRLRKSQAWREKCWSHRFAASCEAKKSSGSERKMLVSPFRKVSNLPFAIPTVNCSFSGFVFVSIDITPPTGYFMVQP